MTRKINSAALDIIKKCEGFSATKYRCPADKWTIGYGHVILPNEKYDRIDKKTAEYLLFIDTKKAAEAVGELVQKPLNDNQFGALVSLVYNIGVQAFKDSTILKKLNDGDYKGAAGQFGRWIYSGGKTLPGLVKRRELERQLFEKEVVA